MNHPDSTRADSSASEAHIRLSPPGKKPELRPQNQKAPPFFCIARSFIHAFIYTCQVGGAVNHMKVNELQSSPEGPYGRCWQVKSYTCRTPWALQQRRNPFWGVLRGRPSSWLPRRSESGGSQHRHAPPQTMNISSSADFGRSHGEVLESLVFSPPDLVF